MKDDKINKLRKLIFSSKNVVAFTGAGVSTESNIPDFRSSGGIFDKVTNSNHLPEEVLSKSFFDINPDIFYEFYRNNLIYTNALPNDCHYSLAELEKRKILQHIITQNIDCLHQKAGSRDVIELHGNGHNYYCERCKATFDLNFILSTQNVPFCNKCSGIVRPDVVLYEEALDNQKLEKADEVSKYADVLLVLGTSLLVYPAASFVKNYQGKKLIIINKTETPYDSKALLVVKDSVGEIMKQIMEI